VQAVAMNEKAKKARNEYFRNWRRQNPEKVRKHQEKYWLRVAKKLEEGGKNNGQE